MNVDYINDDNQFTVITSVISFVPVKNGSSFLVKTATTETIIKASSFVEARP